MPFGGPQVIIQLLDWDDGDEDWYGTWLDMLEILDKRLVAFTFTDHDVKMDKAVLELKNDDFALLDNPVFVRGQKLLMTWGWQGDMAVPRRMIVKKVVGGATLRVVCHCTLSELDRRKQYRINEGMTDSEYVALVAAEYGYQGTLLHLDETTEVREAIVQPKWMTDARMLRKLAKRNGFQFYIDGSGLHWKARKTDVDPAKTFIYSKDPHRCLILEPPEIEANMTRGVAKVRVLARDPFTKEQVIAEVTDENADMVSLGEEDEYGDPDASDAEMGKRAARITKVDERHGGYMTQAEADAEARARFRETAKKKYKLKMKTIGDPRIGGKMVIDLWGFSESFDGLYYIKVCETEISDGRFVQTLTCRKDSLREVKATKKKQKRGKKNPKGGAQPPEKLDPKVLIGEMVIRYNDEGVPQPVMIYKEDMSQATGREMTPDWYELANLPEHVLQSLADQGTQSVLPDE